MLWTWRRKHKTRYNGQLEHAFVQQFQGLVGRPDFGDELGTVFGELAHLLLREVGDTNKGKDRIGVQVLLKRLQVALGREPAAHPILGIVGLDQMGFLSMAYAQFMVRQKKWDDMRGLAVQMRTQDRVSQDLVRYSYFLEGVAEHHLNRVTPAEKAFQKMNQTWLRGSPQLALNTGVTLTQLGQLGGLRRFHLALRPHRRL